ncbi:MAG TPA: hypothetical protein VFK44_01300 [Bacillales bacterium]|nr:hypothetical protein [Bacillales bacterium]
MALVYALAAVLVVAILKAAILKKYQHTLGLKKKKSRLSKGRQD